MRLANNAGGRQEIQYGSTSWAEVFSKRNIVRVHVAIFAHIWAQYSGTNALMYYIVYIFQMAGLSGTTNLTIASIQYIINVVMTVPALLFVDKLPRRRVMMAGSAALTLHSWERTLVENDSSKAAASWAPSS